MINKKVGTIILAAGKGSRMRSEGVNKVVLPIGDKPLILHKVHALEKLHLTPIVLVVGFAKESIMNIVDKDVIFAEQKEQLGTADAVRCGLEKLPLDVENVLVMYGDDMAFPEEVFHTLLNTHFSSQADVTFVTITLDNPTGIGRIVRDTQGEVVKIVEEKDATEEEKKIQEINPGGFLFTREFLGAYLPKVSKSPVTGEYYITSLIDMALADGKKVMTVQAGNIPWRGVNTPEELAEAEKMYKAS